MVWSSYIASADADVVDADDDVVGIINFGDWPVFVLGFFGAVKEAREILILILP